MALAGHALFRRMIAGPDRDKIKQFSCLQFDFVDEQLCMDIIKLNLD